MKRKSTLKGLLAVLCIITIWLFCLPMNAPAQNGNAPILSFLEETVTATSVTFRWSLPCNSENTEKVWSYDFRYSTKLLSEETWDSARMKNVKIEPCGCGVEKEYTFTGLSDGVTYYLGIKYLDETGSPSSLSNIVKVTTDAIPRVSVDIKSISSDSSSSIVQYEAIASDKDGKITKYEWDYDCDGIYDDSGSAKTMATRTYPIADLTNYCYAVIVRVTDNDMPAYTKTASSGLVVKAGNKSAPANKITVSGCSPAHFKGAFDYLNSLDPPNGSINIPEGEWPLDDIIQFTLKTDQSFEIKGEGADKTILKIPSNLTRFFEQTRYTDAYVRFSNITFKTEPNRDTCSYGIILRGLKNFRVDNCNFDGRWNGIIIMYEIPKGLIDHCKFTNSISPRGLYGLTPSSRYQPANVSDEEHWKTNWNPTLRTELGTENSIFVEDCTFFNNHTAIVSNWGSISKMTIRHNKFYVEDGYWQTYIKAGNYFHEIYENTYTYTGGITASGEPYKGEVVCMYTGGVVYNNTFNNLAMAGSVTSFYGGTYFGYSYPYYTQPDNLYIWGNKYNNCKYDDNKITTESSGHTWQISGSYGLTTDNTETLLIKLLLAKRLAADAGDTLLPRYMSDVDRILRNLVTPDKLEVTENELKLRSDVYNDVATLAQETLENEIIPYLPDGRTELNRLLRFPINEGDEVHMRPPQEGDLIYPYTPYPYPHPLVADKTCTEMGGTNCCTPDEICKGEDLGISTDCTIGCCCKGICEKAPIKLGPPSDLRIKDVKP